MSDRGAPLTHYFMSDVHFGSTNAELETQKRRMLSTFLPHLKEHASTLVIAGDLFDFWFEWNSSIPKRHFWMLRKLAELRESGVRIIYLGGNHDFHLGGFLHDQLGIEVHTHPFDHVIGETRIRVIHGDGILKRDWGYRIMRRILHFPPNIALFKLLHPDWGMALADKTSHSSREYTSGRDFENTRDEYRSFARKLFRKGYNYVMLGHSHKPVFDKLPEGTLINLGDWLTNFTFAHWENDQLVLKRWTGTEEVPF